MRFKPPWVIQFLKFFCLKSREDKNTTNSTLHLSFKHKTGDLIELKFEKSTLTLKLLPFHYFLIPTPLFLTGGIEDSADATAWESGVGHSSMAKLRDMFIEVMKCESTHANVRYNKVFGNSLIVERICFFADSTDILPLRLVNHFFHEIATKHLRRIHGHIELKTDTQITKLLCCLKNRETLNLTPFPFTGFEVYLRAGHYSISTDSSYTSLMSMDFEAVMLTLLSNTFHMKEFERRNEFHRENFWKDRDFEIYLYQSEQLRLPESFPHLSVTEVSSKNSETSVPITQYPLLDLIVSRPPSLRKFRFPPHNLNLSLKIIRFLIQLRPKNIRSFSFSDYLEFNPETMDFVQELMQLNLVFKSISIRFYNTNNTNEVRGMLQTLYTWLDTQKNTLTELLIDLNLNVHLCSNSLPCFWKRITVLWKSDKPGCLGLKKAYCRNSFQLFPSLPALKNFTLKISDKYSWLQISLFVGNPFPFLQKLCLDRYCEEYRLFETCEMPSVQELELLYQETPLTNPAFEVAFPNLTSLHIEFDYRLATVFRSTLAYILTRLTLLVHLDLEVVDIKKVPNRRWASDPPAVDWACWDLLTGGVPRPQRISDDFEENVGVAAEEPVNGIYRVPSLRNMKALKTLRFFPRVWSNVDAILYLSRNGLLVPLQKLVLVRRPFDILYGVMQLLTKREIEDKLSRIHSNVVLDWGSISTVLESVLETQSPTGPISNPQKF